jgi:hypothetical protein
MSNIFRAFVHVGRQQLYANQDCTIVLALPAAWESLDKIQFELTFLSGSIAPFERLTGGAPRVGIWNATTGAQLAFSSSFALDPATLTYSGTLNLTHADLIAYVLALLPGVGKAATFSMKYEDELGAPATAIPQTTIYLYKALAVPTATETDPGETAASQSWVNNVALKVDSGDNVLGIRTASNGWKYLITILDDGGFHSQRIE